MKRKKSQFELLLEGADSSMRLKSYQLTEDVERSRDLYQTTVLKAMMKFDTFKAGTNFKAWILRIMFNCNISGYRKIAARPKTTSIDVVYNWNEFKDNLHQIASENEIEMSSDYEFTDKVEIALRELPKPHYEVIYLRDVCGLSYADIQRVLGIPKGTVMSRLHRARKYVKTTLNDQRQMSD